MFSFGWSEIALTVVIIIIVVGPKEIPNLLKQIGSFTKSIKKISREFKNSLNDIAEQSDFKDVKKSITEVQEIKNDLDPTNELKKEFDTIKDTTKIFEKEIKDINTINKDDNK
tara:strand:- start:5423 stop:5761 length:339 start_codon:yes stop_codon:yes gene_type:complete